MRCSFNVLRKRVATPICVGSAIPLLPVAIQHRFKFPLLISVAVMLRT